MKPPSAMRLIIARALTLGEDVVYVSLAVLLAVTAIALVVSGAAAGWQALRIGAPSAEVVSVLDRILLVLMVIELLYTVKISFQEHALLPEPFLIVGLIAVTRRILIVTAQFTVFLESSAPESAFRHALFELGLLTVMVVALVGSLWILRKRAATPVP
jgi:uncharacterized membrane protein (DUF373 family)